MQHPQTSGTPYNELGDSQECRHALILTMQRASFSVGVVLWGNVLYSGGIAGKTSRDLFFDRKMQNGLVQPSQEEIFMKTPDLVEHPVVYPLTHQVFIQSLCIVRDTQGHLNAQTGCRDNSTLCSSVFHKRKKKY